MLCYTRFICLFIVFQLIFILPQTRFKKFQSYTYKVPVCKTGMMSLLQSSLVQHSTAHSSWVNLCLLSPLKKPPTAAQAAFLSVIVGQKRKKSRLLLNLLKGNNTKNLFIFVLACAFSVRNSCLPTLINQLQPTPSKEDTLQCPSQVGFPLSRIFSVRFTHVNFTRVNKIETMYGRSLVSVKG